jgi:hypothetical protein
VALDAKTDTSTSSQRLELLERELEDLKERFLATERLIQDEKNLIASSKQEAEDLTTQLKTELAELSTLSRHIVLGEDKDDEAAIVEADRVRLEAIVAIDEFLSVECFLITSMDSCCPRLFQPIAQDFFEIWYP